MNPSGLMADSLFGVNGDNRAWDGIWDARVVRSEIGWTIESESPFRTLNFDPNNDTWGFNFQRTVRRKNEDSILMGWARNQGLRRMTNAGHVTGIREVTQGLTVRARPGYISASTVSGIRSTLRRAASPRTCTAERPTPSSLHSLRSSTSSSTTP
jgi:hypothetical protein